MLRDARDYQILFLSLFLALGIGMRDWTLRPEMIAVAIATCLATQALLSWMVSQRRFIGINADSSTCTAPLEPQQLTYPINIRSPLITSLSLSLLLRADHVSTMALAAGCAIASKFFLKVNDKHFFNPANFGIIAALLLTQDAWVSPGQWGEDLWLALLFLGAGGIVLKRVGRWDTTAAFLGMYALLEAVRNLWLDWTWDVWLHRLSSGSFLLFALFMITDPRSIPNARIGRLVWAGAIALATFILRNGFFLSTAVFWALFALAPLTLLLDYLWPTSRFAWQPSLVSEAEPPSETTVLKAEC